MVAKIRPAIVSSSYLGFLPLTLEALLLLMLLLATTVDFVALRRVRPVRVAGLAPAGRILAAGMVVMVDDSELLGLARRGLPGGWPTGKIHFVVRPTGDGRLLLLLLLSSGRLVARRAGRVVVVVGAGSVLAGPGAQEDGQEFVALTADLLLLLRLGRTGLGRVVVVHDDDPFRAGRHGPLPFVAVRQVAGLGLVSWDEPLRAALRARVRPPWDGLGLPAKDRLGHAAARQSLPREFLGPDWRLGSSGARVVNLRTDDARRMLRPYVAHLPDETGRVVDELLRLVPGRAEARPAPLRFLDEPGGGEPLRFLLLRLPALLFHHLALQRPHSVGYRKGAGFRADGSILIGPPLPLVVILLVRGRLDDPLMGGPVIPNDNLGGVALAGPQILAGILAGQGAESVVVVLSVVPEKETGLGPVHAVVQLLLFVVEVLADDVRLVVEVDLVRHLVRGSSVEQVVGPFGGLPALLTVRLERLSVNHVDLGLLGRLLLRLLPGRRREPQGAGPEGTEPSGAPTSRVRKRQVPVVGQPELGVRLDQVEGGQAGSEGVRDLIRIRRFSGQLEKLFLVLPPDELPLPGFLRQLLDDEVHVGSVQTPSGFHLDSGIVFGRSGTAHRDGLHIRLLLPDGRISIATRRGLFEGLVLVLVVVEVLIVEHGLDGLVGALLQDVLLARLILGAVLLVQQEV